jgi:hypothetical protein
MPTRTETYSQKEVEEILRKALSLPSDATVYMSYDSGGGSSYDRGSGLTVTVNYPKPRSTSGYRHPDDDT